MFLSPRAAGATKEKGSTGAKLRGAAGTRATPPRGATGPRAALIRGPRGARVTGRRGRAPVDLLGMGGRVPRAGEDLPPLPLQVVEALALRPNSSRLRVECRRVRRGGQISRQRHRRRVLLGGSRRRGLRRRSRSRRPRSQRIAASEELGQAKDW